MSEHKQNERNFSERGLRQSMPKPNILRIETLDGKSRQRYMGTLDAAIDKNLKQPIYNDLSKSYGEENLFYGFMESGEGGKGFKITPEWKVNGNSTAAGMLTKLGDSAGKLLNSSKNPKLLAFSKMVSGGATLVDGYSSLLKTAGGIDNTLTGSSTMKSYAGFTLSGFEIKCSWYLPEQLDICRQSLNALLRMTYPSQLPSSVFNEFNRNLPRNLGNTIINTVSGNNDTTPIDGVSGAVIDVGLGSIIETGGNIFSTFADIMGKNLTIDPLPVRVSIGHSMDVEPMVITGVDINYSNEKFIVESGKDKGKYFPLTCSVGIAFTFWMNPAPKLEFLNMLGAEMFGKKYDEIERQSEKVNKKISEDIESYKKQIPTLEQNINRVTYR